MSEKHKEPLIYRRSYELTLIICRFVKDMKTEYKTSLGLLLQKEALEFIQAVYRINDSDDKVFSIGLVINKLYFLRTQARLLLDLGAMNLETNILINDNLENSLTQLIAWQKK